MHQKKFADKIKLILSNDNSIIGMAVGGSWLTNEVDEFSDLDIIIVTKYKISEDTNKMFEYAKSFGQLLTGFTGEHVGEKRLLICLYDNPLLHVDLKFLTLDEFKVRVENPQIILDEDDQLKKVIEETKFEFPYPNYQWFEERFWVWVHYTLQKIGRGELFEATDVLNYFNTTIICPLLHIKNNNLPRGVRKAEVLLSIDDLEKLKKNLPDYSKKSIFDSLENCILMYQELRKEIYPKNIKIHFETEIRVLKYLKEIKLRV